MRIETLLPQHAQECLALAHEYPSHSDVALEDFSEKGFIVEHDGVVRGYMTFLYGARTIHVLDLAVKKCLKPIERGKAILLLITMITLIAKAEKKRIIFNMDVRDESWCNCLRKRLKMWEAPYRALFTLEAE